MVILGKVENLLVDDAFKGNLKLRLEEKRPLSAMDEMLEVLDKKNLYLSTCILVVIMFSFVQVEPTRSS